LGLLSRRKNALDELTSELESLQHRKSQLAALLSAAEQRLDEATRDRQTRLLESDLTNGPPIEVPVFRFTDERDAVVAALAAVDSKLLAAQASVDKERDRIQREASSKELAAVVEGLTRVHDDLAAVAAKVAPALSAVLARLPPPHVVAPERVKAFLDGVIEAVQTVASEAQTHAARLISGDAQVACAITEPVKSEAALRIIERREIFILAPSKWVEPSGEVITAGPHVTASPPVEIAKLALQHGHALEPLSEHAIVLRQRAPPNYACFSPQDCVDLTQPKSTKPPGAPTAALPLIHSEFVGQARVGTARVARI
jgi:hypothetical protein